MPNVRRLLPDFTGLAGRVFVGTALIALAVLGASIVATTATLRRSEESAARRRLEQDAEFVAHLLAGRERSLAGGARVFTQNSNFRAFVENPATPHEDLFDQANEAATLLGASWVFLTDAHGRLLAKSDEPTYAGAEFAGVPLVAGALRGQVMSGFGASGDSLLFQAVAVPIVQPTTGTTVGVLVATSAIGDSVTADVRATTGSEVLFYALGTDGRPHVTAASLASAPAPARALDGVVAALFAPAPAPSPPPAAGARVQRASLVRVGDTSYHVQGATATTAGGDAVGGWLVLRPHDVEPTGIARMRESIALASLIGLALALGAAWLAARRVTRPIRALAAAARRAAEGDYDPSQAPRADLDGDASDEIAALGAAFHAMIADLRDREELTALGASVAAPSAVVQAHAVAEPAEAEAAEAAVGVRRLDAGGSRAPTRTLALSARRAADVSPPPARRPVLADRYELQAEVGAGGTGIVYRALDRAVGEVVAVKMLRPELLAADPLARERLTHELRLARRISHRHVVRTHDFAESDGVPFLTMEYVDGPSLDTLLRAREVPRSARDDGRGLPPRAVLAIAKQLMRALDVAHAQGVVHGDLKPANVLVALGGVVKVSDFGVARLVRLPVGPDATRIAGAVVGTPEYMAPEILLGGAPDVRADIYAAGVVLHECLTGETPFHADTPVAFFAHKLDDGRTPPHGTPAGPPVRPPLNPRTGLAAALVELVARMTATDPADRPASARTVSRMLEALG